MRDTGEVFAWGTGFLGFCPEGCVVPGPTKTRIPRHVATPDPVETVACGPHHCLLICNRDGVLTGNSHGNARSTPFRGGKVYSWGRGQGGVLGHGTDSDCTAPTEIPGLRGRAVVAVGCGAQFSVALDAQGRLYTWGSSAEGQLGRDTNHGHAPGLVSSTSMPSIASFACGRAHVLARTVSGALFSWGSASHGQTGHLRPLLRAGENDDSCVEGNQTGTPPQEAESDLFVPAPRLVDVCGIGDLISQDEAAASRSPALPDLAISIVAVAAGDNHSLCVTASGVVLGWGSNEFGQVGASRRHTRKSKPSQSPGGASAIVRRPTTIAALPSVVSVACGALHSAAVTDVGDVYAWGYNGAGQLGLGDTRNRRTPCPIEAVFEFRVTQVSLGHEHSGVTLSRRDDKPKQTAALREASLAAAKDARKVVSEAAGRLASELAAKRRAEMEREAAAARGKEAQRRALARQREERERAERLAKERAQSELRDKLEKAALEKAARKRAQEAERQRRDAELQARQKQERETREAAEKLRREQEAKNRAQSQREEEAAHAARDLARQQADARRSAEEARNRARQREREQEREARRKEQEREAEVRRSKELLERARSEEEERERIAKQKRLADKEARRRAKAQRLAEEKRRAEELLEAKAEAARKKNEQDKRRAEATRKRRLETKRNEEARMRARAAEEKRKQVERAEWLKTQELKRKEALKAVTKKRIRDARRKAVEEAEREVAERAEREAAERAEMDKYAREKAERARVAREQMRKRKERRTVEAYERRRLQEEADRIAEEAEAAHRAKEAKRLEAARRARQQREQRDQQEFIQNVAKLIKAETTIEADKKQRRRAEAVAWMKKKKKKKENFADHGVASGGGKKMRPMASLVGSLSLSPRLSPRSNGSSRSPRAMTSARRVGHIDRGVLRPKSSPTRQRPAVVQRRK